ncbi:MAG: 2-oxo acid dehydrogenase subunit E2 [Actinobacteria bacterium]|nr:2-oxo acid dehydrogenase subunit E2 [Actinomycetota bacterium]
MGLEVTEGLVVEILVAAGGLVAEGDPIIVLATDKADTEVHAPATGVVREISVAIDEAVPVGAILMVIADSADEPLDAPAPANSVPEPPAPEPAVIEAEEAEPSAPARRRRVAPIARRAAAELGVDLETVTGTGPNGRVTLGDVELAASRAAASPPVASPATPRTDSEPVTPMRRAIARRMTMSQRDIPQYQLVREVDATHLTAQKQAAASAVAKGEAKPGVNDLLVQAVALTVERHPILATIYEEREGSDPVLRRADSTDVGLAVATDAGLVVPVIRAVGVATLREIAAERSRLVDRARAGNLDLAEMSGGVISLSNLGGFGIDRFTAMVNPGQATIVAVGRTVERVVPRGRGTAVVPILTVTLSCDHRTVDGAAGAAALVELAQLLEGDMPWRN